MLVEGGDQGGGDLFVPVDHAVGLHAYGRAQLVRELRLHGMRVLSVEVGADVAARQVQGEAVGFALVARAVLLILNDYSASGDCKLRENAQRISARGGPGACGLQINYAANRHAERIRE